MEILNSTVYNSQDLHDLIVAVHSLCTQRHTEWNDKIMAERAAKSKTMPGPGRPWARQPGSPLPEQFQIGYYNRKPDGNWASIQGKYRSGCPRLGIPRLSQMPINAMVVLADSAAGPDQGIGIPQKQKEALVKNIAQCFRGNCDPVDRSLLAEANKVRFTQDVTKLAAKKASRDGRIARLQKKLARQNTEVSNASTRLNEAVAERDALIEKIKALDPRAEMRLRV